MLIERIEKTGMRTRLQIQGFWLFSLGIAFACSKAFGQWVLFFGWTTFVATVSIACIALAITAVQASRSGKYTTSRELRQFAEIFDRYLATVPILGLFCYHSAYVSHIFGELKGRYVEKARKERDRYV